MPKRRPPARGGLYKFGAEIENPVVSYDEFDAQIRDANEKGEWLGTDANIEAVMVGAENQAWAIIGPAMGISERAERFYRLPGETWRPYAGERLEPVVGIIVCIAERLPEHAKSADPRMIWAGRVLSLTRRLRGAIADNRAGVAASYAHELGSVYEAGLVEFGHARTVAAGRANRNAQREKGAASVMVRRDGVDAWALPIARAFMAENPEASQAALCRALADEAQERGINSQSERGWAAHVKRWREAGAIVMKGTRFR